MITNGSIKKTLSANPGLSNVLMNGDCSMTIELFDFKTPDIRLAAVCGLFCPACSIYIGNREEPERIKRLAARFNMPEEEFECLGCRSDKRSFFAEIYARCVVALRKRTWFSAENAMSIPARS